MHHPEDLASLLGSIDEMLRDGIDWDADDPETTLYKVGFSQPLRAT